jgi:hypothetical protein
MDGHRFDLMSRWLVNGSSRRSALRALVGGAFAAGLSGLGLDDAAAKCVNPGKKCKSKHGKKKCCGGAKCQGSKCKCPAGLIPCGGRCVDAENDLENCGACGNACGGAEICRFGSCCVKDGPKGPHNLCCTGVVCNPPGQNCVCACSSC